MMTRLGKAVLMVALLAAPVTTLSGCASTRSTTRQIDDATITASVKTRLAQDPDVKAHQIDVDTIDGKVTLTGEVKSSAMRAEAVKLAQRTEGVVSVRDNLSIGNGPTVGAKVDDIGITTRVKAKLAEDDAVKARNIDVDTLEGVVTLTGKVQSWSERSRAAEIAQATSGVRSVRNLLEVATGG